MKIAILGATGHLAKCALWVFAKKKNNEIYLFSRTVDKAVHLIKNDFICKNIFLKSYDEFKSLEYDVIFNGVGSWDARELSPKYIFEVTEYYDNLIIEYQKCHPSSISIHISSGAAYANQYEQPVNEKTETRIKLNAISVGDYYSIAKINSEAKHRAFSDLNIVDIRLFGFFSRFMSLDYSYFLSAIINAIKKKQIFTSINGEFWRDYIHMDDFSVLCNNIVKHRNINTAIDVISKQPISKSEMLEFFNKEYGLEVRINNNIELSKTGLKPYYYSVIKNDIYIPKHTSLEAIKNEIKFFLEDIV